MANQMKGLGKGLGALLGDNVLTSDDERSSLLLPISQVESCSTQPRKSFDPDALADLSESIRQHGIIQPLTVRKLQSGYYQIIAGERRWRAARMAGLTEVPAIVIEADDRKAMELAMIENLQREDLNPIEEAEGYQVLMSQYNMTQEETAQRVGKSRSAVANALRLLNLCPPVRAMVEDGRLTNGHARALLAFPEELREQMAEETLEKGLTVHELERRARQSGGKTKKSEAVKAFAGNPLHREVELALAEQMGRRVRVTAGRKGGTLQVEFLDDADLKALANRLTGEDKEAVKLI